MRRLFCVVTWACVTVAALSLFYYHAYAAWLAADSEQILLAASLSSRQNHCNNIVVVAPQGFVFEPRRFLVDAVDSCSYLPFTTSRADVFWCSTQNMKVPVSSIDRFEMVRLWTFPLALMRKWFVCLSWIPFLIHMPTTWGWESSTSKVAVSLSVVLISVRPLLIVIFRAARIFLGENNRINPLYAALVQVNGKQKVQRLSSLESLVSFSCHRIGLEPVLCSSLRFNNTS